VRDGYVEVAPGTGDITTADKFGDVQLHIEWATPAIPKGEGQERGNSGVFLMDSTRSRFWTHTKTRPTTTARPARFTISTLRS